MPRLCDYELLTYESKRIRNVTLYVVSAAQVAAGAEVSDPECIVWKGNLRMLEQEVIPSDLMDGTCDDQFKYTPIQSHNLKIEFFRKTLDNAHDLWATVYYNPLPNSLGGQYISPSSTIKSSAHCPAFYHVTAQLPLSEYIGSPAGESRGEPDQVALGLRFNDEGDAMEFRDSLQAYERRFKILEDDFYERQARNEASVFSQHNPILSPIEEPTTSQTVSNDSDFEDSDFDTFVSAP